MERNKKRDPCDQEKDKENMFIYKVMFVTNLKISIMGSVVTDLERRK